jgi:hypothetical protein
LAPEVQSQMAQRDSRFWGLRSSEIKVAILRSSVYHAIAVAQGTEKASCAFTVALPRAERPDDRAGEPRAAHTRSSAALGSANWCATTTYLPTRNYRNVARKASYGAQRPAVPRRPAFLATLAILCCYHLDGHTTRCWVGRIRLLSFVTTTVMARFYQLISNNRPWARLCQRSGDPARCAHFGLDPPRRQLMHSSP